MWIEGRDTWRKGTKGDQDTSPIGLRLEHVEDISMGGYVVLDGQSRELAVVSLDSNPEI